MVFVVGLVLGFLLGFAVKKIDTIERGVTPHYKVCIAPAAHKSDTLAKKQEKELAAIVIQPESERDIAREKLLEENKKRGVDTPIEDLS